MQRKTVRSYILNIGLTVNGIEPEGQLSKTLEATGFADRKDYKAVKRQWKGKPENSVALRVEGEPHIMEKRLQNLCKKLNQNAIAVFDTVSRAGFMVYSPDYQGERYKWDANYFNWDY